MKTTPLSFYFFIIALISLENTQAQSKKLTISTKEDLNSLILDSITFNNSHHSKNDITLEILKISKKLSHKGFFNNSYTLINKDSSFHCTFTLNKKIDSIRISYSSPYINNILLNKISNHFTSKYFQLATNDIESSLTKITTHFENNGFSFTTCQLQNITLNKKILKATLNLSISKKRKINNIVIKGYDRFPRKFLKHHLNLDSNKPFSLNFIKTVSSKLKSIPFISQIKEPEILFTKDSTTLYLYLKNQNRSNFDGIIGFSNKKASNKIQLHGNLNLTLKNTLHKGESFSFHWINDGNNSQRLNLNLSTPFLFNTPISSSSKFSIIKQDSTYHTTSLKLSLNYQIKGNNFLGMSFNTENSNINTILKHPKQIESYNKYFYGLHFNHKSLAINHTLSDSKFQFNFGVEFGNRKTNRISTSQQHLLLSTNYSLNLNSKNSIFIKNSNELLITNNPLTNELFRIGGTNTIRGFDEQSIFTSKYSIINLEYYHKLKQQTHIHTITDFAFIFNNLSSRTEMFYGIGIGFLLTKKNHSINISYTTGNKALKTFSLKNPKINIKFSTFF